MWSAGFCLRHRWAWMALVLFGTAFNFAFGQAPDSVRQAQASPESSPPVKYMAVLRRQAEQGLPPTPTEVAEFWKTSGRMSYQAVKAHQAVIFQRVAARLQREGVTSRPFLLLQQNLWYPALHQELMRTSHFRATVRLGNRIGGVYVADTVVAPERVEVDEETVIIARSVVVEGKTLVIRMNHPVFLFHATPICFTEASVGRVVFDTSGQGYQDRPAEQAQQGRDSVRREQQGDDRSGRPGDSEPASKPGKTGDNGQAGADGDAGNCTNGPNGKPGVNGAKGQDGTDGVGGGDGKRGGDATQELTYTTPCNAQPGNAYVFRTNGGDGGGCTEYYWAFYASYDGGLTWILVSTADAGCW